MSLINFYETLPVKKAINPNHALHGISVPFRAIVAAPSGSGKSNGVCNLLLAFNKTFHEIIYCIKSSDEPLINMLEDRLNVQIVEDDVPPLSTYEMKDPQTGKTKKKDNKQRLIIFDDFMNDTKANKEIVNYYKRGRKVGLSMIYISQSYYQIPKLIRDNTQIFMIGRNLLRKDLKMILSIFGADISLDEFVRLYNELTAQPMSFITINNETKLIRQNITGDPIKI